MSEMDHIVQENGASQNQLMDMLTLLSQKLDRNYQAITELTAELKKGEAQVRSAHYASNYLVQCLSALNATDVITKNCMFMEYKRSELEFFLQSGATAQGLPFRKLTTIGSVSNFCAALMEMQPNTVVMLDYNEAVKSLKGVSELIELIEFHALDIMIGKGPGSTSVRLDFPLLSLHFFSDKKVELIKGFEKSLDMVFCDAE